MKETKNINKKWLIAYNKKMAYDEKKRKLIFRRIKRGLPMLEKCLEEILETEGVYEGEIYRFYHYSFKVYNLHRTIDRIVKILQKINPHRDKKLCRFFEEIIDDAKNVGGWEDSHNKNWTKHTRPIVEAFFHAKYMLEMMVLCGKQYDKPPKQIVEQKWASILELYNLR